MSVFRANSRALITGGASGIGYAVAELCLEASMKVTVVDYNDETLELAKKNLKGDVTCIKSDVGDLSAWKSLRDKVGDVDFLMLNAGRMVKGSWGESEYFNQVIFPSLSLRVNRHGSGTDSTQRRYSTRTSLA